MLGGRGGTKSDILVYFSKFSRKCHWSDAIAHSPSCCMKCFPERSYNKTFLPKLRVQRYAFVFVVFKYDVFVDFITQDKNILVPNDGSKGQKILLFQNGPCRVVRSVNDYEPGFF